MKIHNECGFITKDGIAKIENMYKATFVMESCIKMKDGSWGNFPAAIFYTEEAHPQGSNYFALYRERFAHETIQPRIMITNGISATEDFKAIRVGDDIYYSRYRHDYRGFGPGDFFVDGGRDYIRYGGEPHEDMIQVKLRVNKDKLEVVE